MTLKQLKDWFKASYNWTDSISIGKIDSNRDRAICFYNSRIGNAKITTVGGSTNRSYEIKPITVLLRFSNDANVAEQKAKSIYDFFDERRFTLNEKRVFIISRYNAPIDLGTDENGIYEHSFEFDVYCEK